MILHAEPGKGGRYELYADDRYLTSVTGDVWFSLDLTDGQQIEEEEAEQIVKELQIRRAYAKALSLLTRRAHSEAELMRKLQISFSFDVAQAAVAQCREVGFTDDAAFAADFARELAENKLFGPARIRTELMKRGVSRELIQDAIDALEVDFSAQLVRLAQKKYPGSPETPAARQRLFNGLMRYGYDSDDIRRYLHSVADDGSGDELCFSPDV